MSGERRAVEVQRRLDVMGAGSSEGPETLGADPYGAGWLGRFSFQSNGVQIESGIVVDAVPGAYCYRVAAGRRGYVYCSPGGPDGAFGASGTKSTHAYPLFTRVFFLRHPETGGIGTILGAEPHWSVHTANQPADGVWPFVRTGTVEAAHRYPFELSALAASGETADMQGVEGADLSAGRPIDATAAGEWGKQTETGLGLHLDPFQVYLRVNEATGVFGFYDDSLLRVAGHNFQLITSQLETEHLEDEGELYGCSRGSVYPWEAGGLWRPNQVTPGWTVGPAPNHGLAGGQGQALFDPLAVQAGSGLAVREPELRGQLSAARLYDWTGYLGQAGHRAVAGPVQLDWAYPDQYGSGAGAATVTAATRADAPSRRLAVNGVQVSGYQALAVPPNAYGGPDQPGLLEEHRSLTGRLTVRTTRGVLFAKYPSIPTPRPVRQPADPAGDGPETYAPSGRVGNTAAHKVVADPTPTTDPGLRACMLPDAVAYLFNWEALHPFAYHERDWAVAQEGAAGSDLINQRVPDYASLAAAQYLAAPDPVFLDVDHRYGPVPVHENTALMGILDDGSIVFRDGWGSEIVMGGGKIRLRAAADVEVHAGRDVQVWAGYDVVLKAHNSVDVTAANGDVRTKAERNHHHLAGNSGAGGFLFETKAECPVHDYTDRGQGAVSSGFVVRAPQSQIDLQGADVLVALGPAAPSDGRIFLDAGHSRSVYQRGKVHVTRVTQNGAVVQLFDDTDGAVAHGNEFTADHALINTNLMVNAKVSVATCLSVDGWVTASGHVATGAAAAYSGTVARYTGSLAPTSEAMSLRAEYLIDVYAAEFDAQVVPAPNAQSAEFSYRTDDEYLSTGYRYWASHWEAMAAADGQALTLWDEPPVVGTVSGLTMYPFPGTVWTETGGHVSYVPILSDLTTGLAADRTTDRASYEAVSPPPPSPGKLSERYKVVAPPP